MEDESVKDNFVIIYELLDEAVDNGYIQCVDIDILQEYIKTSYHELIKPSRNKETIKEPELDKKITWRKEGIKHKENELYLDIVEKVHLTSTLSGSVSRSEIIGVVRANSKLSGMPTVELAFNNNSVLEMVGGHDKMGVELDDVKFHKCVEMPFYQSTNKILFIPPDGEFELLTYYIRTKVKSLFNLDVERLHSSKTKACYKIRISSNFKNKSTANDVSVFMPVPCDLIKPKFKHTEGKMEYLADKSCIKWKLDTFSGEEVFSAEYEYSLPTLASRKLNSK